MSEYDRRLNEGVERLAWLLLLWNERSRFVRRRLGEKELELVTRLRERSHPLAHERERLADDLSVPLGGHEVPQTPEQVVLAQLADPHAVEPVEPCLVPFTAGAVHLIHPPAPRELVHGEDLLLRPGRPSDQREVIDHRLGEVALCLELLDLRRAVPLRELLSIGPEHIGHVRVRRDLPAERPPDEQVLRRRRQPVLAAE